YRTAQSLNPLDATSYNNMAYVYATRGSNLGEALKLARRAQELAPNSPFVLDTLGLVHYRRGEYAEAEPVLRKAVGLPGSPPAAQYHLGMTYYRLSRRDDAIATLRRALQLNDKGAEADEARRVVEELTKPL